MNYKLTAFFNRVTHGTYNFTGNEFELIEDIKGEIQEEIKINLLARPETTESWLLSVFNEIKRGQNDIHKHYVIEGVNNLKKNAKTLPKKEFDRIENNNLHAQEILHFLDDINFYIIEAILRIKPKYFIEKETFKKAVKDHLPRKYWHHLERQKDQEESPPAKAPPTQKAKPTITHAQIALIAIYRGHRFNDPRSIEDVKYKNLLSEFGIKPAPAALNKNYRDYYYKMGRTKDGFLIRFKENPQNEIKDITAVLPYLNEEEKKTGLKDIEYLENLIENI